jgi:hypothetical protein
MAPRPGLEPGTNRLTGEWYTLPKSTRSPEEIRVYGVSWAFARTVVRLREIANNLGTTGKNPVVSGSQRAANSRALEGSATTHESYCRSAAATRLCEWPPALLADRPAFRPGVSHPQAGLGRSIQDTELLGGHSAIEYRRERLAPVQVASADADFAWQDFQRWRPPPSLLHRSYPHRRNGRFGS